MSALSAMPFRPNDTGTYACTGAALIEVDHNLGRPAVVQPYLECQTAEFGYSVGDILQVNAGENAAANASYGLSITHTATSFSARLGQNGRFQIINKTSGIVQTMTAANWRIGFYYF